MIPCSEDVHQQLITVTVSIFETMAELPLIPSQDDKPPCDNEPGYSGEIHISGQWNGSVLIHFSEKMAGQVAQSMLSLPPERLAASSTLDVLGEILNMIGGNMKSMLPGPSHLSLPYMKKGPLHPKASSPDLASCWAKFNLADNSMWVSILEQEKA